MLLALVMTSPYLLLTCILLILADRYYLFWWSSKELLKFPISYLLTLDQAFWHILQAKIEILAA